MDGLSPTKPENTGRLKMSSSRPSQMCYKEKKRRIFFTIGLLRGPEPSSISQILYFPSFFILFYFIFIIIYKSRYLDLWRASKEVIPVKKNLVARKVLFEDVCDHCHSATEDVHHAL